MQDKKVQIITISVLAAAFVIITAIMFFYTKPSIVGFAIYNATNLPCGATMDESSTFSANVTCRDTYTFGLNITCSNCVLDCQGYSFNGDSVSSLQTGLIITGSNVTIQNCSMNDWTTVVSGTCIDGGGNSGQLVGACTAAGTDNPPVVSLNYPSNSYVSNLSQITFNCSATDDYGLTNITLYGNWSGWHANETQTITGTSNSTTFTKTLEEGTYIWNCYACDNASQCSFATSNYSLTIDSTPPLIQFVEPTETNNSIIARNNILVNVSASDAGGLKNITIYLYNSTALINSTYSTTSPLFVNFTNLADGIYYFNATAFDIAGNVNSTETRIVIINVTDTTPPSINIVYPENKTYNINVSELNYSYSDENPGYCWYSRDGGVTNSTPVQAGINFTNVISTEGSNTWFLYCFVNLRSLQVFGYQ